MTQILEEAIAKVSQLPVAEQDAVAKWLLSELESQREWDQRFSESGPQLAEMAREALAENRRRRTRPLSPEKI